MKPRADLRLSEAVEDLMRRTGRTRRQARQAVLQALKSGELVATGIDETGKRVTIPPEFFRTIPSEH